MSFVKTKLYNSWRGMKERCNNSNHISYARYGGRGIKVCSQWENFDNFKIWAENNGYIEGLTIERINNDGNYEPDNCTWIERGKQVRNYSRNHKITINGKTKPIWQWAEENNLVYGTVKWRIYQGLQGEDIIKPVTRYRPIGRYRHA